MLNYVFIAGSSGWQSSGKSFKIDWANKDIVNITFPEAALNSGMNYALTVGEEFFGVKQLSQYYYSYSTPSFSCYHLNRGVEPMFIYQKNSSKSSDGYYWNQAIIVNNGSSVKIYEEARQVPVSSSSYYNYTYTNTSNTSNYSNSSNSSSVLKSFRVVTVNEVSVEQAFFSSQNNDTFATRLNNGKVEVFSPGCASYNCLNCKQGFTYNSLIDTCRLCAPGCSRCSNDSSYCYSCNDGLLWDYNTQSCEPCSPKCLTCGWKADYCYSCHEGFYNYYNNGTYECLPCNDGCGKCYGNYNCSACAEGFTRASN